MKRSLFTVVLFTLSFAATAYDGNALYEWAQANDRINNSSASGTDPLMSGMFTGFVVGISNYMIANDDICVPSSAKNSQAMDIVKNYLRNHPEKRTDDAVYLVNDAMRAAFPCKKK